MPATLTRGDVRVELREILGEQSAKTWTDAQLNRYIMSALREMSKYGILRGIRDDDGTGASLYDIPAEIMRLTNVQIDGATDVRLCPYQDYAFRSGETGTAWVVEEDWQIQFWDDVPVGDGNIKYVGNLWHPELDPDDSSADSTAFQIDNRFAEAIVNYSAARALRQTEDEYKRYDDAYRSEMAEFGFKFKIPGKVQYTNRIRRFNERCRW